MINVRRIVLAVIFSVVIITAGIFTVSEKTEAKNTVNDFLTKDDLKDIVLEFKESKYTLIANDTIDIEINTNLSDKNARFSYGTDNSSAVIPYREMVQAEPRLAVILSEQPLLVLLQRWITAMRKVCMRVRRL